jgi:hypothetical protein
MDNQNYNKTPTAKAVPGSLVVWIPFRDSDGTLDVSETTKFEVCADDMLDDGWRWIKFNEENGEI